MKLYVIELLKSTGEPYAKPNFQNGIFVTAGISRASVFAKKQDAEMHAMLCPHRIRTLQLLPAGE